MVRCPKLKWFWMRHFHHPFCFWRLAKFRRCDVHGLRQRWCGNMVHSEEGHWLLTGDGLSLHGKETWSQYCLCVDRTTSTRGVQWYVIPRIQHFMTYSDKRREWDEGQCEGVLHLWRKRCREPPDRLEVWSCISESMFHVHFTIPKPAPPPKHYVSIRSPPRLCSSMESSVESQYPIMTSQADLLSCSDSVLQYIITSGKSSEWSLLHAMSGEM